ncbi:uncharacterized protein P174DRAFT_436671 [Aspergillus novofumigatus IBT 16806]|uniref:Uncharacterized protein n=1 Tax=Aspergillus novofumigatus (strain IBT 16806) TaxID=1392255 RepID=A0A2I1CKX7_ASPN1|nr:uncharacterized protein P174DRAFT_436671 [Aspergillus novofumigatus IBT 16806]PKX98279.1 hypothetical protein P174DRAFT_436671 [Aspergillus novofumigatus IBT 16806]
MSHPYLCPSAYSLQQWLFSRRILIFGWMITFYLLAHGMEPDAYLSDTQSDSVDEEALMCRMRWKTGQRKLQQEKRSS